MIVSVVVGVAAEVSQAGAGHGGRQAWCDDPHTGRRCFAQAGIGTRGDLKHVLAARHSRQCESHATCFAGVQVTKFGPQLAAAGVFQAFGNDCFEDDVFWRRPFRGC